MTNKIAIFQGNKIRKTIYQNELSDFIGQLKLLTPPVDILSTTEFVIARSKTTKQSKIN